MAFIDLFHPQVDVHLPSSVQTLEDIFDDTTSQQEDVQEAEHMNAVQIEEKYPIPAFSAVGLSETFLERKLRNGLHRTMNDIILYHQPNYYKPGRVYISTKKTLLGWTGVAKTDGYFAIGQQKN